AAHAGECIETAALVGNIDIAFIDRHPAIARQGSSPARRTAGRVEASNTALIGNRTYFAAGYYRRAGNIGNTLEFSHTARITDRHFPAWCAIIEHQRQQ